MAKNIYEAMLEAQADMPGLQKNAINPHFGSKFISLDSLMEQILPVLNKHGIVLMQMPTFNNGESALRTKLIHPESNTFEEDVMPLCMAKNDPQGQGSGITYARRYSLMAMLGLVADSDDDGSQATSGATGRRPARQRRTTITPQTDADGTGEEFVI